MDSLRRLPTTTATKNSDFMLLALLNMQLAALGERTETMRRSAALVQRLCSR
jgi:hypothetical protein